MKKLCCAAILSLLALSQLSFANELSYQLPITRNGQTKTRVASLGWSGEYPTPVINVFAGRKGYYRARGFKSLRKLTQPLRCSIKYGLYHPWSKTRNSVINYYRISALQKVRARKPIRFNKTRIKTGQVIFNIQYASEGVCVGNIKTKNKTRAIDFECEMIENNKNFRRLTRYDGFNEQWLYVKCRQGYNAFIKDTSLLKQPGVRKGTIKTYGVASP